MSSFRTENPATFEQAMSALTLAIASIERHGPATRDEADRLNWSVQRLDRAAVKADAGIREMVG